MNDDKNKKMMHMVLMGLVGIIWISLGIDQWRYQAYGSAISYFLLGLVVLVWQIYFWSASMNNKQNSSENLSIKRKIKFLTVQAILVTVWLYVIVKYLNDPVVPIWFYFVIGICMLVRITYSIINLLRKNGT